MDINVSAIINQLTSQLRNPQNISTKELIERCAFYLPTLRNIDNVRLLIGELLFSPAVLSDNGPCDLNTIVQLTDNLQYSIHQKLIITDPLISFSSFIDTFLNFCQTITSDQQWRTLPLLSSISKFLFSNQFSHKDPAIGKHRDILLYTMPEVISNSWPRYSRLVTFCLGRSLPELPLSEVPLVNPENILNETIFDLYESIDGLNSLSTETVAYKYLNSYSLLIKDTIIMAQSPNILNRYFQAVDHSTSYISRVQNEHVVYSKRCLFGLLIQLEGVGTIILQRNLPLDIVFIATKTLVLLGKFNQIVMKDGISGLDQYKYIYYLCIDVILSQPTMIVDKVLADIIEQLNVSNAQKVFIFDLSEHLLPMLSNKYIEQQLSPMIQTYLRPKTSNPDDRNVLESAHSVMLKIFVSKPKSLPRGFDMHYLDTVTELFPNVFNSQQFSIVMSSLAESMNSELLNDFLHKLFIRCKTQMSGIPLVEPQNVQQGQLIEYSAPPTIRASLVSVLLKCLPFTRPSQFQWWLDRLPPLLHPEIIYNDLIKQEQTYLMTKTWDMISSELSPELQKIGISWWYGNRHRL